MGQALRIDPSKTPRLTDPQRCSGCGRCITACPEHLYSFEQTGRRKHSVKKAPQQCTLCGKCIQECPLELLSGEEPEL